MEPEPVSIPIAVKMERVAVIQAQNLCKTYRVAQKQPGFAGTLRHFFARKYKEVRAVRDVCFAIEEGQIVGFLGPNGAGKTTTLKMLTGLLHPTTGTASVLGYTPFRRQRPFLEQITLVMGQKQQLLWDLPASETLRINAAIYGIPDDEARRRLDELSEMLALKEHLTQPVRKLSLGERMKAELLAALMHRPRVLFLDEPTIGLDVNAQAAVRQFLREYNRVHRATLLLTSHYMADIVALCPRVLVIHHGSVIYDGSLEGIAQRFAPWREVTLELAQDAPNDPNLSRFGEVESVEGRRLKLIVQQSQLTQTVARVLGELNVVDLKVSDPPIEQTIARIFQTKGDA